MDLEEALYESKKYNAHQLKVIERLKEENSLLGQRASALAKQKEELEKQLMNKTTALQQTKAELKNCKRMLNTQTSLAKLEADLAHTRNELEQERRQKTAALTAVRMYEMSAQLFQ